MAVGDLRPIKAELREQYKALRREMPPEEKQRRDREILRRVLSLWQYKRCRLLLTYVSTAIEVDTRELMARALADGHVVAVPRCVPGTRDMEFYAIRSLEDLSPGTFGVLEPAPDSKHLVTDYSDSLCIVPALCYDWKGFRLGYGGGYYDRFLASYDGSPRPEMPPPPVVGGSVHRYVRDDGHHMIGIAYASCVRRRLPHGRYDRPVSLLVTDHYLRRTYD